MWWLLVVFVHSAYALALILARGEGEEVTDVRGVFRWSVEVFTNMIVNIYRDYMHRRDVMF